MSGENIEGLDKIKKNNPFTRWKKKKKAKNLVLD